MHSSANSKNSNSKCFFKIQRISWCNQKSKRERASSQVSSGSSSEFYFSEMILAVPCMLAFFSVGFPPGWKMAAAIPNVLSSYHIIPRSFSSSSCCANCMSFMLIEPVQVMITHDLGYGVSIPEEPNKGMGLYWFTWVMKRLEHEWFHLTHQYGLVCCGGS